MKRFRTFFVLLLLSSCFSPSVLAWEVNPTALSGTEGQALGFEIVVEADEWDDAGVVCNDAVWDFEFQLDGTLIDGTAEWGADLSSPFAGGALLGICSNSEEEVVTPYTISVIEDFTPENNEDAEIFFEHCEEAAGAEGVLTCTEETLLVEIVEVPVGGLPEVGIEEVSEASEPDTDGQFRLFLAAPAPGGGVEVGMFTAGTATAGSDYVALPGTVFFAEGTTEVLVNVVVIDDGLSEGTESVMVTLLTDPNYVVSFQHERATVLIGDDDGDGSVRINQGISDAWFNPATPGQGFFIIVFPEIGKIFMAWFTYDVERPPPSVEAILGDPGHRWFTAFGDFVNDTAVLAIEFTEGGVFNAVPPQTVQSEDGTITLEFSSCTAGLVHYEIPSLGLSGTVPIQRLTLDNVALCQSQSSQ